MRFARAKSAEELEFQALHRVRHRLVGERTAQINQIRGLHRIEHPLRHFEMSGRLSWIETAAKHGVHIICDRAENPYRAPYHGCQG
jgi:transposase